MKSGVFKRGTTTKYLMENCVATQEEAAARAREADLLIEEYMARKRAERGTPESPS